MSEFETSNKQRPAVLVVDDEEPYRNLLSKIAGRDGYEVRAASCADEAEQLLRERAAGIIVCDQSMPGEDGISLLGRLQNDYPDLQRIMLTGNSSESLLQRGVNEAHLFYYLTKPVIPDQFLHVLKQAEDAWQQAQDEHERQQEHSELLNEVNSWQGRATRIEHFLRQLTRAYTGMVCASSGYFCNYHAGFERDIDVSVHISLSIESHTGH